MFSDNHMHTSFSPDSNASMESMIKGAIAKNFREIVFTDHLDFDFPDNPELFLLDLDQYLVTFNELKAKYQKDINLLLGVEVGAQPHVVNRINQVLKKYPFDFVICSTHTVAGINCSSNSFFSQLLPKAAYVKYFEGLLSNLKHLNNYDVCGHLDFIARYNPFGSKQLNYKEYGDIIDTILKTVIESGHGIELNTSGYRYGLNQTHPSLEILQRYRQLGGEIVTVGSDAHRPEDIGANFLLAYELLTAAGFNYITRFIERKPHLIRIDHIQKKYSVTA